MLIDRFRFGKVRVDGAEYRDDLIIIRGVVSSPWWRSAGGHVFAPQDLSRVIEAAPEVICLGTGAAGMVQVEEATYGAFAARGTEVVADLTGRVIEVFNRLAAEGRDVAAALHLTC